MDAQSLDSLRQISRKIDDLVTILGNGGAGRPGSSALLKVPDAAATQAATLQPHLQKLAAILDPQELLTAIMDAVVAVTGAQRGFLMLVEEGSKLRFKVGRGVDQQSLGSDEFSASRTVIKQVLQSGEPVLWDDSQGKEKTSSMKINKLKSVICVPLKMGARLEGKPRVGGVVYVDSTAGVKHALGEPQMAILKSLADQAAIALENAQIFQKSEKDKQQVAKLKDNIARLYSIGRKIASTLILEELLVNVVDSVVEVSHAQRGFVMLLEQEKDDEGKPKENAPVTLAFKVGRDMRKRSLNEEAFRFSTSIARKAIDEKKAQVLTSALGGGDDGEEASVSIVQMKLQSIMCVPLIEKEQVIGLVYVDSQQENKEFDESDVEVVESLAGQAAVAIVNAKLYKEVGDKERIRHELELGAKIQGDLLPKVIPPVDGATLYGFMKPAKEVGGDYYDFIVHEGTRRSITIAIGDVSGKGVGAGLVMAMARSAIRSLVNHEKAPKATLPLLQGLNSHLCGGIPKGMFMTLNLLIWDADTKKLKYTSAGHEHLLIYRAKTKDVEKIKAGGTAAGVLKQANALMKEKELDLAIGDQLLLYTDGVSEAMNSKNEEFGLETVEELVRMHGMKEPKELCDAIHDAIIQFRGEAEVHDDITLVALKVTGKDAPKPPPTAAPSSRRSARARAWSSRPEPSIRAAATRPARALGRRFLDRPR